MGSSARGDAPLQLTIVRKYSRLVDVPRRSVFLSAWSSRVRASSRVEP